MKAKVGMDWPYFFTSVWTRLGGGAVAIAALAFLIRELLKHRYSRDLENHRGAIQEHLHVADHERERVRQEAFARKEADKALFQRFVAAFPPEMVRFLREQVFGGTFSLAQLEQLQSFLKTWADAEHEFLDAELNAKRKELCDSVSSFLSLGDKWFWHPDGREDLLHIPRDVKQLDYRAYQDAVKSLEGCATLAADRREELVRMARARLNC